MGINTAITRQDQMGRVVEGIGFAVPINLVKEQMDQLKTHGKVSRGYLGVKVGPVDADAKDYLKSRHGIDVRGGALIQSVDKGTPAAKAGASQGRHKNRDRRQDIKDTGNLSTRAPARPKKTIRLDVYAKEKRKLEVMSPSPQTEGLKGEQPGDDDDDEGAKKATLGITVEELSQRARQMYRIPEDIQGVLIRNVDPKSNAFSKGIRDGLIITEVNGEPVGSVSDFKAAASRIKSGEMVSIYIQDGNAGGSYIYFKAE